MKHSTKSLIFLFILFFNLNSFGQEDKIKDIKTHYYSVSKLIAECEKNEPENCIIYRNDLVINSNEKQFGNWPAVGNYFKKITFWYDRAPAHWDEKGKEALLKIVITEIYAAHSDSYEFLFKDGELIFCFFKEKHIGEYRFYFSDEKLIKYLEKTESDYFGVKKEDYTRFIKEAKRLQSFFLTMFQ